MPPPPPQNSKKSNLFTNSKSNTENDALARNMSSKESISDLAALVPLNSALLKKSHSTNKFT